MCGRFARAVLFHAFLLSVALNKMDNSDGSGSQPTSSIRSVFTSLFGRDRSASAVLTSFKELQHGEDPHPDGCQIINGDKEDTHRDNVTTSCDTGQKAELLETCQESDKHVKTAAGALVDPDWVQVTRVETYSDTENEEEEASNSSSKASTKLTRTGESTLPEVDISRVDHGDGDEPEDPSRAETEYNLPVFRTHKLKDMSYIESILYSERFTSRTGSRTVPVPSVSKQGDDSCPKESNTTVSADMETACATKNSSNAGTDENEEHAGVDCSLPVPSLISGHVTLDAVPVTHTEDLDGTQKEETVEDPHDREVSSALHSSSTPKTPEVSVHLADSPDQHSDSSGITSQTRLMSSAPEESLGDIQPSASPAPQCTTPPKTPETNQPPLASSIALSHPTSSVFPSRGTPLSSPPSFQMPALFSGLRVLKKGVSGEDRDTMSEIKQREKDAELALLSLKKSVNKTKLFPDQKVASPTKKHTETKSVTQSKSTVMRQLFNQDNHNVTDNSDKQQGGDADSQKECEIGEEVLGETTPVPETRTPEKKKTSDLAYETFRSIFGPKSVKKEKTEEVDLEAVKKKIKNDKENLRSIFERVSKSPSKEVKSPTEPDV